MLLQIIPLIVFIIILLMLIPNLKKWISKRYCKYCNSWFTLKEINFECETTVVGHDQANIGGGIFKIFQIFGLFTGTSYTRDQPFLREFGKFDYLCNKCGKITIIHGHRDRR